MEKPLYESLILHLKDKASKGLQVDPNQLLSDVERMAYQDPQLREARLAEYEYKLAKHKNSIEYKRELYSATINTAIMAVKSGILINGGACVAVMGLMAGVLKENSQGVYAFELNYALASFGLGVLFAALTTAAVYFAQYNYRLQLEYRREERIRTGNLADIFRAVAICLVLLCYICFLSGLVFGYKGLP